MYKCEICDKEYKTKNSFSIHIGKHMSQQEYYDLYLKKDEMDGKCKICGKPTRFDKLQYANCCCQSCRNKWINQNRTPEEREILNEKIRKSVTTEEVREKKRRTNIDRYGVPYTTQNAKVQEKRRQTCQEKYGVNCSFQADSVKEKIQDTIHERYGEEGLKNKEIREKSVKTCIDRYGVINAGMSEQSLKKIRETNLSNYGVEYSFQAEAVKKKIKQTNKDKFGYEYPAQSSEIQEKIRQTNQKRYGVNCQFQRDEVHKLSHTAEATRKKYATKKKNGTFNASSPENRCYDLLVSIYTDAIHQYSSDVYPYDCDFYIPYLDLYIELNIFWTHGKHFFNKNNKEDIEKLNKWKEKNTAFYKKAIEVWTDLDLRKLECARNNKLNYLVCWSEEEFKTIFSGTKQEIEKKIWENCV